jgi:hypothetical protein
VSGRIEKLRRWQNGRVGEKRPDSVPSREYTRSIRQLVDIGASAEKEVIQ